MNRVRTLILVFAVMSTGSMLADSPAPEREYAITSPNGKFTFTMYPVSYGSGKETQPRGVASRIGSDETLWSVTGWYASETFIADDGHHLVRIGPWASRPMEEELAVAFYRNGQEIRRYVVAELIDDSDSVQRTVSHYNWQKRNENYPRLTKDGLFELITVENAIFAFDIANGLMVTDSSHADTNIRPQITIEDVDDRLYATNLFRENNLELHPATITRVVRGSESVIWINSTFAGLPVFFHDIGYRFDERGKVVVRRDGDQPAIIGTPLPGANAFPVDHHPDIDPDLAVDTWLKSVRNDRWYGPTTRQTWSRKLY